MAVNKSELVGGFTRAHEEEIRRLEVGIDERLRNEFAGGRVVIKLDDCPHDRVRQELERRYRAAGWQITFHSDQRDGEWFEIQ